MSDEIDSTPVLPVKEKKYKTLQDLSPEQMKQLEDAHQLKITAFHMLKEASIKHDHKVLPTMKKIYFDSCRQYSKTYERLGL
jgi:hypothetical protein